MKCMVDGCKKQAKKLGNKRQRICEDGHGFVLGVSGVWTLAKHSLRKGIQGFHNSKVRRGK